MGAPRNLPLVFNSDSFSKGEQKLRRGLQRGESWISLFEKVKGGNEIKRTTIL